MSVDLDELCDLNCFSAFVSLYIHCGQWPWKLVERTGVVSQASQCRYSGFLSLLFGWQSSWLLFFAMVAKGSLS